MTVEEGPVWLPALNAAEVQYGLPHNLLARIAYQESHFRADVIDTTVCSKAGCKGLMQLNPTYWPEAGLSPDQDIECAAQLLATLYLRFNDWQISIAAYNAGGGTVHRAQAAHNGYLQLSSLPTETQNYVKDIVADVPVPGALVPC